MTNKTKAIVMANKALRAENIKLWEDNDALQRGLDEMKLLYETMIKQLVISGMPVNDDPVDPIYRTTLRKVDEKERAYLDRFMLAARADDDGMHLTAYIPHDEEDDDDGTER